MIFNKTPQQQTRAVVSGGGADLKSRVKLRRQLTGVLLTATLLLSGCVTAAAEAWQPRGTSAAANGVTLLPAGSPHPAQKTADTAAGSATGSAAGSATASNSETGSTAGGSTTPASAATTTELLQELHAQPQRLHNPAANVAASFFYLPGAAALNQSITEFVRDAVTAADPAYQPQPAAAGAQLPNPGCIPDVTSWDAQRIVTDRRTAPPATDGMTVVCELRALNDTATELRLRAVQLAAAEVVYDNSLQLVVDRTSGRYLGGGYTTAGADELWRDAVQALRLEAGSLSLTAIGDPSPQQTQLAAQALASARSVAEHLVVELPAGIAAPELAVLGVAATTEPRLLQVTQQRAKQWAPAALQQQPEPTADGRIAVACDLLPCVALTYDDGPGEKTAELLQVLEQEQVVATFFMLGPNVQHYSAVAQRAAAAGHELGSHTMRHPSLPTLPLEEAKQEVLQAKAIIEDVTGAKVRHFRPPYGDINERIVAATGLPAILWDVDTEDWKKPGVQALYERSVPAAKPGSIILFHDIHPDSVAVAQRVVQGLKNRGFSLVTVSDLLGDRLQGIIHAG